MRIDKQLTLLGGTLGLALVLGLSGCGKHQENAEIVDIGPPVKDVPVQVEETGEVDPIASPEAKHGGSFTSWGGGYPKSLNMWLDYNDLSVRIMQYHMFEPLVDLHSTKDEPVGYLAQSWEISPDKKTFTFKIHPKATWSDGKPVTAEDVQFYYDVMMNPKNLTSMFRVDLVRFERPEVVDEKTIRMTAKEVHWKNFWIAGQMFAFPKHIWDGKDFNSINFEFPVVSGPYALDEVKTNRSIRLKRRPDWWGRVCKYNQGKYNFDYLVFKAMEDRNKVLEALKKGDYDLYPIYTAKIWAEQTNFPQIQKNWVVRQEVYNKEPIAYQGFAMNLRRPLFQDIRVRQALSYLLNRDVMNDKLMFNLYFLLNSYYPDLYPNNQNPDAPTYHFNPEKARALFAEAGWKVDNTGTLSKDGKPFEFVFLHHDTDLRHLNIYIEDLKAVGIKVKIEIVSFATFVKRLDNHEFDMAWYAWSFIRLRDPEPNYHSSQANEIATQNIPGIQDEEIDRLIAAQREEMDLGKRNEILKQIDNRLTAIVPYVLLWQSDRKKLLYWNKFGTPKSVLNKFDDDKAALWYWWYDPVKGKALEEARRKDTALPALPGEVRYAE